MAGLLGKITSFVRSPSGQRALRTATGKAQELAKDPRTKDKISQVRQRFQGGGSTGASDGSPDHRDAPGERRGRHGDEERRPGEPPASR